MSKLESLAIMNYGLLGKDDNGETLKSCSKMLPLWNHIKFPWLMPNVFIQFEKQLASSETDMLF